MNFNVKIISAIAGVVLGLFLFWLLCLNHVGVTNVGIAYNSINGTLLVQNRPGWYVTSPFVSVAHMSTLPMRVTIPSEARIINSKIVKFKPEGAVDFIKMQGFSVQLSSEQENIMMGYAFSGQTFSFLEIVEEGKMGSH
jgi:hypothetical protein